MNGLHKTYLNHFEIVLTFFLNSICMTDRPIGRLFLMNLSVLARNLESLGDGGAQNLRLDRFHRYKYLVIML